MEQVRKLGLAIKQVAIECLPCSVGDRLMTISDLTRKLGVSRGTVQSAIAYLESEDAIRMERRGKLGTFLTARDTKKLLGIAGALRIIGAMPLPYSRRYEGLATGLCQALQSKDVKVSLAFMRGSDNRIQGCADGRYDFVVLSRLAARHFLSSYGNLEEVISFENNTYVGSHILVSKTDEPRTIGVDRSSYDHVYLTEGMFRGKDVEFIPLRYSKIVSYLKSGQIDGTVWNSDDLDQGFLEQMHVRQIPETITCGGDTAASLICRKDDLVAKTILGRLMDKTEVLRIQASVMRDELIPSY